MTNALAIDWSKPMDVIKHDISEQISADKECKATVVSLTTVEIDELCERLNNPHVEPTGSA